MLNENQLDFLKTEFSLDKKSHRRNDVRKVDRSTNEVL